MSCYSEMFSRHLNIETGIEDIRDAAAMAYGSKHSLVQVLNGIIDREDKNELAITAAILGSLPCENNTKIHSVLAEALTAELKLSPWTSYGYAGRFKDLIAWSRSGELEKLK